MYKQRIINDEQVLDILSSFNFINLIVAIVTSLEKLLNEVTLRERI